MTSGLLAASFVLRSLGAGDETWTCAVASSSFAAHRRLEISALVGDGA